MYDFYEVQWAKDDVEIRRISLTVLCCFCVNSIQLLSPRLGYILRFCKYGYKVEDIPSGGFRLGPGGTGPPNLAQAPQIFDWFHSALFLLEGFWGPEICLECVGAGALPRTPLGKLMTLPQIPQSAGAGEEVDGDIPSQEPHASRRFDPRAFSVQRSLLGATCLAYTHLNCWQYTTNWFYSNFA